MNSQILIGKTKDDFKINKVGDNNNVAKVVMIVPRRMSKEKKVEAESKGYPTADFPQIEIWGSDKKINMLNENVKKGDEIRVEGFIKTGSYNNKSGEKVYTTTINVNEFKFDFKSKETYDNITL
jgi:single-strand DNA-binding protein